MSGALSALSSEDYEYATTRIYDRVQKICAKINLRCYLPHKSQTTPIKVMPHSKVWEIDYERVVNSKAIVAYIGIPACGVGAEIEMARRENVPVILLFESAKKGNLPQLMLGNPKIRFAIAFDKPEDIDERLEKDLKQIFTKESANNLINSEKKQVQIYDKPTQNRLQLDTRNVYICGTLGRIFQEEKKYSVDPFFKTVSSNCKKIDMNYVPDPTQTFLETNFPKEIWERVKKLIEESGVVVANVGEPDCDVGTEVEMAHTAKVPVILLFEKSHQEKLSRLILGNPRIKYTLPFDRIGDIEQQLRTHLILILSKKNLEDTAYSDSWPFPTWFIKNEELAEMEQLQIKGVPFSGFPKRIVTRQDWSERFLELRKESKKVKKVRYLNPSLDIFDK